MGLFNRLTVPLLRDKVEDRIHDLVVHLHKEVLLPFCQVKVVDVVYILLRPSDQQVFPALSAQFRQPSVECPQRAVNTFRGADIVVPFVDVEAQQSLVGMGLGGFVNIIEITPEVDS